MVHPPRFARPLVLLFAVFAASCATSQAPAGTDLNRSMNASSSGPREQTRDQQVQHVLNRLAFGPRPGDVQEVQIMGVDAWISRQLHPERIDDKTIERTIDSMPSLQMTGAELIEKYPPPGVLQRRLATQGGNRPTAEDSMRIQQMQRQAMMLLGEVTTAKIARAVGSERQLNEVMVDFWENHFSVFAGKERTRYFIPEYTQHVIRPHALGKFRELLGAVAKSPAMLYYLDNWQSTADSGRPILAPNGRVLRNNPRNAMTGRRRGLNENYARELMELHTLGVDGGYTQQDVVEVARALPLDQRDADRFGGDPASGRLHPLVAVVLRGRDRDGARVEAGGQVGAPDAEPDHHRRAVPLEQRRERTRRVRLPHPARRDHHRHGADAPLPRGEGAAREGYGPFDQPQQRRRFLLYGADQYRDIHRVRRVGRLFPGERGNLSGGDGEATPGGPFACGVRVRILSPVRW